MSRFTDLFQKSAPVSAPAPAPNPEPLKVNVVAAKTETSTFKSVKKNPTKG